MSQSTRRCRLLKAVGSGAVSIHPRRDARVTPCHHRTNAQQ